MEMVTWYVEVIGIKLRAMEKPMQIQYLKDLPSAIENDADLKF